MRPRDLVLGLARQRREAGEPLLGAAVGAGLAAQAAAQGGADFILALNAGRYRMMGAPSVAAMLPLADANEFTFSFAESEILDRIDVPVVLGVSALGPVFNAGSIARRAAAAGFAGIANFPTVIHYDGRFRHALEEAGMGFAREVELMQAAAAEGLLGLAYAKTRQEVEALVAADVPVICLNFGWNAGGIRDVAQEFTLDEASERARRLFRLIRRSNPQTLCLLEGGPIVSPADMFRVWHSSEADGYLGGSTLDRVPLERAIIEVTSAFKTVGYLRAAAATRTRRLSEVRRLTGIAGHSEAITRAVEQVERFSSIDLPVLVIGEPGSGRMAIARSLHTLGRRGGRAQQIRAAEVNQNPSQIFALQKGSRAAAPGAADGTLIVPDAEALSAEAAQALANWHEAKPVDGTASTRFILIGNNASGFAPETLRLFRAALIAVPPLRERPEDILPTARHYLAQLAPVDGPARRIDLSADCLRQLLAHRWPGNTRELRRIIDAAAARATGGVISAVELAGLLEGGTDVAEQPAPMTEAEWLMDALRKNRFRKGDAAAYLGISRKTLYNRMKALGLRR